MLNFWIDRALLPLKIIFYVLHYVVYIICIITSTLCNTFNLVFYTLLISYEKILHVYNLLILYYYNYLI